MCLRKNDLRGENMTGPEGRQFASEGETVRSGGGGMGKEFMGSKKSYQ